MKIGISTSCFYPLYTEKALLTVAKTGCECTELFFNAESELKPDFIAQMEDIRQSYDLSVSSIHPTMSLAESFMLFSAYDRRLEEGLDAFRRYGEIAAGFGAKYVILHGGKPNGILDDRGYCERFLQIAEAVKQNGAELLQENVVRSRACNIAFLSMMQKELGDAVGFCLDIKQAVRGGYAPEDAFRAVGKNVKHLHISDHTAENDCLLPLRGDYKLTDFLRFVRQNGYRGDAVIEVYQNAYQTYEEVFNSAADLRRAVGTDI